ncbi:MAG: lipoyl(octanoyl) transferase LipB [Pseudomonadota bacterium]|nr:lipoyl(octanoyl) transferase LipB [Pseudomonadota bacterium]
MTGQPILRTIAGLQPYEPTWRRMRAFTDQRDLESADELWQLQHQPVYTLGQAGREEHLLTPGKVPVVRTDRGGQVTYHGPGQLVLYVLLELRRYGLGVRTLVELLEQSMIECLMRYGVDARVQPGAPGVYVGDAKIAALGLRIRHGRSYHGLALNLDLDTGPFDAINPCGYPGLATTRLVDHTDLTLPATQVGTEIAAAIMGRLGVDQFTQQQGWK